MNLNEVSQRLDVMNKRLEDFILRYDTHLNQMQNVNLDAFSVYPEVMSALVQMQISLEAQFPEHPAVQKLKELQIRFTNWAENTGEVIQNLASDVADLAEIDRANTEDFQEIVKSLRDEI